jgi:hypothetical protein
MCAKQGAQGQFGMPAIDPSPALAAEKARSMLNRNRAGTGYLALPSP